MDTSDRKSTDHQAAEADSRLGPRIIEIRNRRGWSQRMLAGRAGIRPTRLSKLERALKQPKLGEFLRLALALEVDLAELAFGEAPRAPILHLVRELEALGTPEEIAGLGRLLQLLLLGYRAAEAGRPTC